MGKKYFSVIIVPHAKTNVKTLSFSKKTIKFLAGGAGVFVLAMGFLLVDYFSMTYIRSRYKGLRRENADQKEKIANYESSLVRLKNAIAGFENYAKKLNIMMGFESADMIKDEPGLGGGDPNSGAEPEPDPQSFSFSAVQNLTRKAESVGKNLDSLVGVIEGQTVKLAMTPTIWPTKGWVSSQFGYRADPFTGKRAFHRGIDIATNYGNPVLATADGTVLQAAIDKFFGKNVVINHGHGVVTQYGHLDRFIVKGGQKIKRGEVLGYIGKTGKALGPHLHYEVRINDKSVNPYNYILEE